MPQTVIIDGNNVVRVVDSGPPGPPGFASHGGSDGPSGPTEMLPLAVSRMAPWCGWAQFNGLPVNTNSYYGVRQALSFAVAPLQTVALETVGMAPIFTSNGQEMNFSWSGFGIDYSDNEFPEGCTIRISAAVSDMDTGELWEDMFIIGEGPVQAPNFSGPPDSEAEVAGLIEQFTNRHTFTLPDGAIVMGLMLQVYAPDGELFDFVEDPELLSLTLCTFKISMWEGDPDAVAVVDPNSGHTWLGMQNMSAVITRYGAGFGTGGTILGVTGGGLFAALPSLSSLLEGGETLEVGFLPRPDDDDNPTSLHWATPKLRVADTPTHPTDVVRLMDLAGDLPTDFEYGIVTKVSGENTLDATLAPLYKIITDEEAHDVILAVENPTTSKKYTPQILAIGHETEYYDVLLTGAASAAYGVNVGPGEVWLFQGLVWKETPAEDPNVGCLNGEWIRISTNPLGERREIPKMNLSRHGLVGGKIPIDSVNISLDTPTEDTMIEFVNPGPNRYAIINLEYVSGPTGEGYALFGTNHYHGGKWEMVDDVPTMIDPNIMSPSTPYRYQVFVFGTGSGPAPSDCTGGSLV